MFFCKPWSNKRSRFYIEQRENKIPEMKVFICGKQKPKTDEVSSKIPSAHCCLWTVSRSPHWERKVKRNPHSFCIKDAEVDASEDESTQNSSQRTEKKKAIQRKTQSKYLQGVAFEPCLSSKFFLIKQKLTRS